MGGYEAKIAFEIPILFWAPTDEFVATNLAAGMRFSGNRIVASVNANNVFDERVQQHVWSDIINRKVWAQVILRY